MSYKKINFTKMVANGNDFVVIDNRLQTSDFRLQTLSKLARQLCNRKKGIGSDGLLVIEDSKKADIKMRIFNPDGSEAEMCGNGLRCAALYKRNPKRIKIETEAGIYETEITAKDTVKVKMEEPKNLRFDLPISLNGRRIRVNYIDSGVPHAVIFIEKVDLIDVAGIGENIRYHKAFKPRGTNVDFVEVIDDKNIKMRTYERGVEAETLACGTGAVASAIITSFKCKVLNVKYKVNVITKGGRLKVCFEKHNNKIKNVYLEGEAKKVFEGSTVI